MAELWPFGPVTLPHEVTIDGHAVVIPDIPVPTLLGWLAHGHWWLLFPGSLSLEDSTPFFRRFLDDDDDWDYEHFYDIATTIFGRMTGLADPWGGSDGWWPGRRLAATALLQSWAIYAAHCSIVGADPVGGPLYRTVATMYGWIRSLNPGEDLAKADQVIFAPPPHALAAPETELPRGIRDQEAAWALAALGEALPGESSAEWGEPTF